MTKAKHTKKHPHLCIFQVVKGYSKSTEYLPGEEFVDTRYRNTWNAVYVAGGWRLIQCNWAMLNLHSKVERETRKFYQVKKLN
jgi:hypothetical protein